LIIGVTEDRFAGERGDAGRLVHRICRLTG
jgi:hypothetical protein